MRQTSIPQLSLAYLATQLRRVGAAVRLRDAMAEGLGRGAVIAEVARWRPGVVFVNAATATIAGDLDVIAAIKDALPEATTVIFGPHASATHETLIASRGLDAVIRGEPERTGAEILERLGAGRDFGGIRGLTHKRGTEVVAEPAREYVRDLDSLGWPARDLLPNRLYVHPVSGRPYTAVAISRGCPFKCTFCVAPIYYGGAVRTRSVGDVLDELEHDVLAAHGIDHCWFHADDLLADKDYLGAICRGIIERGLKIRWWGNTRADARDRDLFALMARAGCFMLAVGGESGDDGVLARAKKGITRVDVAETVRLLRAAGITSLVYFLMGLPGETADTLGRTAAFAKEIDPDFVEFYPAIPFPGTELARVAEAGGLVADRDLERYECGGTRCVLKVAGVGQAELERRLRQAYRDFYLDPRRALRAVRGARSPRQALNLLRFGLNYFKRLEKARATAP